MNKVLEFIIGAKDRTGNAIKSALGRIRSFAQSVGTNLMNIKAGLDMASGVVRSFARVFAAAIGEAFRFEKAVSDFKVLLGSIDSAKEHIADLRRFASSTPLTFGDLSQASKLLLSFGASVGEVMPSLKMLGDISMGNRQKFQGLALVFAQVKSAGKLMGQDLLQMINQGFNPLTVIAQQTGESVSDLKDMMAEGAISFEMVAEAMRVATSEGGLFHNAMAEASKTGEGLVSTLQDKWTDAVREFGDAFSGAAKGGIQGLIDKLTELTEDGTIAKWAAGIADTIDAVCEKFREFHEWLTKTGDKAASDKFDRARNGGKDGFWTSVANAPVALVAATAGGLSGMLSGDGYMAGYEATAAKLGFGSWADKNARDLDRRMGWGGVDIRDAWDEADRERRDEQRAKYGKGDDKPDGDKPNDKPTGGKSLREMLDEQRAEEAARKADEEAQRLAEKTALAEERYAEQLAREEERARIEIEKAIARERERLQRESLDEYRKGLVDAQSAEADAQRRLDEAERKEQQAWGWYRDRDSWKAHLEEERADAEAQKQFEKDFQHLKRFRDWRTTDRLSDEDELIRRVALAREEKAAAEEYAKTTAEATQRAADALEKIQNEIVEG